MMNFFRRGAVGLLVSSLVIGLIAPVLTVQAVEGDPVSVAFESNRVVANYGMSFGLYDNAQNKSTPLEFPEGWTIRLLRGNAEVSILTRDDLAQSADGWYRIAPTGQDGTYTLNFRNPQGSTVLTKAFTVASTNPFVTVFPPTAVPGQYVTLRVFNENGASLDVEGADLYFEIFGFLTTGRTSIIASNFGEGAEQVERLSEGVYRVTAPAYSAGVAGNPNVYTVSLFRNLSPRVTMDAGEFKVANVPATGGEVLISDPAEPAQSDELPPVLEPEDTGASTNGADLDQIGNNQQSNQPEAQPTEGGQQQFSTPPEPWTLPVPAQLPPLPAFVLDADGARQQNSNLSLGEGSQPLSCSDLEGQWSKELISSLLAENIYPVSVVGDAVNCRPNDPIVRKMVTTWILAMTRPEDARAALDIDLETVTNPFIDLDENDPFARYVIKAYQVGLVSGKGGCARRDLVIGCKFGGDEVVNRAELITILTAPYFLNEDYELSPLTATQPASNPITRFSDISDGSAWFYGYLYFAVVNNMIQGLEVRPGVFEAQMGRPVTFAEAAVIINKGRRLGETYPGVYRGF
ncbi:hypothetical protein CO046_03570 [Candidatus Peregrinibacteria bacterium CG_4_9_14_0_2_um_filter_53_11]|nr:MAG: hypothetical protein CO046_03570 [Candidatus Peregrinibacteria bacterium CG_4_9_14_0_2_um_filter_53_11]